MSVELVAQAHYAQRAAVSTAVAVTAAELWAQVSLSAIAASWQALVAVLSAAVGAGQRRAAVPAAQYVADVAAAAGRASDQAGGLVPESLVGVASDGRDLTSLLYRPAVATLTAIGQGTDVETAHRAGGVALDMIVRTQVADAGRAADQVAIVADRTMTGYVRMLQPPSCSRCVVLAGRRYRWNQGFRRHPRCDCVHIPTAEDSADDLRTNPRAYFDSLTPAEQDRAFTAAGAQAIRDGADVARVVNARRAIYTAGGRTFTRDSTTRRGTGRQVRLTPDQIYIEAGGDRDEALRLLRLHGYIR